MRPGLATDSGHSRSKLQVSWVRVERFLLGRRCPPSSPAPEVPVSRPVSSPANPPSGGGPAEPLGRVAPPAGPAGVPGPTPGPGSTPTPPAGTAHRTGTPPTATGGGAGGWRTRVWPWARWVLLAAAGALALV